MLVYSFVARGNNVLADYTSYTGRTAIPTTENAYLRLHIVIHVNNGAVAGNFATVAIQCLDKLSYDKVRPN